MMVTNIRKHKLYLMKENLLLVFVIFVSISNLRRGYGQILQQQQEECCYVDQKELAKFEHIRQLSHKFLINIGAQKSGTTLLFHILKSHPQASAPITRNGKPLGENKREWIFLKEMHFFDVFYKGNNFRDYLKSFNLSELEQGKTVIESTPDYLLHTRTACLIKQYLPNAKFAVILKEPASRALSLSIMWRRSDIFQREAIVQMSAFKKQQCDLINRGWTDCFGCYKEQKNLLAFGFYGPQLQNWLQFFKPEQFLILNHQETADLQKTADKIFQFAGLHPHQIKEDKIKGYVGKKIKMSKQINQTLDELKLFFEPYDKQLYKILQNDFQIYDFKFD